MYKPKFLITLKAKDFYPDNFVCLGSQLITIVRHLQPLLTPHIWFAADIDTFILKKIGDDEAMIKMCSEVDQFLSGDFCAIENQYAEQNLSSLEVATEDEQFRPIDINGVLIEIRAVDTSYFEIYSEDRDLIRGIAKKFNKEMDETKHAYLSEEEFRKAKEKLFKEDADILKRLSDL